MVNTSVSKKYRFILCFFVFVFCYDSAQANAWKPVFNEDGIDVWAKDISGTSIIAFRGETIMNTNIHQLFTILYDPRYKKDFLQNVVEFRNLKIMPPYGGVVYVRMASKIAIIDDRDVVIESKIIPLPEKKQIRVEFQNSFQVDVPKVKYTIRIPRLKGIWLFEAFGADKTKVSYQVETDPGGLIPKWIVNLATKKLPFRTLKKLRKLVAKPDKFEESAKVVKYLIDFKPFLGLAHPSSQRNNAEAQWVKNMIKERLTKTCESGVLDACRAAKEFKLPKLSN